MTLEILEEQRRIVLDGDDVALGARAYDVLVHLVANRDRIVSKEELLTTVWAGRMVEESNLTVQIATLRKVLGRDAIKTVPGIGYRYAPDEAAPPGPRGDVAPLPVPAIPSLAVLPFANLTGSDEKQYLVDGIVNAVIGALSQVSSFLVISSTSSFTYKGRVIDLSQVGRELGVRYILEGSIQQAGERLRIFTQLVEAASGATIWRDRFDGSTGEIFELQDDVAARVAAALEPKLIWAEASRSRKKPTENLTAYDLCLRAAPLVYRQNALSQLEEGLELLRQALALDPDYTDAKALICYAHTGALATRWWRHEEASAALPLAYEVLASGTDDPLALCYVGHYVAYVGHDHERGMEAVERASLLNPNSSTVALLLGWLFNYADRPEEAIPQFERVRRLSPLHPQIGLSSCGIGYAKMMMGDCAAALPFLERSVAEYPEFATSYLGLIAAYSELGMTEKARHAAEKFRAKVPDMTVSRHERTTPQTSARFRALVHDGLRATGFPD